MNMKGAILFVGTESGLHLSFTFTLLLSTSNRDANIVDSGYAGWVAYSGYCRLGVFFFILSKHS